MCLLVENSPVSQLTSCHGKNAEKINTNTEALPHKKACCQAGPSPAGTDKLKEALAALGLKSGGTPQQRAERLWLTRSTPLDKLDRKLFTKASAIAKTPEEAQKQRAVAKETALLEAKVISDLLSLQQKPSSDVETGLSYQKSRSALSAGP